MADSNAQDILYINDGLLKNNYLNTFIKIKFK